MRRDHRFDQGPRALGAGRGRVQALLLSRRVRQQLTGQEGKGGNACRLEVRTALDRRHHRIGKHRQLPGELRVVTGDGFDRLGIGSCGRHDHIVGRHFRFLSVELTLAERVRLIALGASPNNLLQ